MLPDTGAGDTGDFSAENMFLDRIMKGAEQRLPEHEDEDDVETETSNEDPEETLETLEEDGSNETTEDDEEEGNEPSDDDDEPEDEEPSPKKPKSKSADDDLVVKVKVDGKEHSVPVKDLKRLYGQETALNRKSQEVADQRKRVEDTSAKQVVALTKMFERAQERAAPYQAIDFFALTKDPNVSAEEISALRHEAQRAFDDVNFYGTELESSFKQAQTQRQEGLRSQAVECMKVLNDPQSGIKGWNRAMYDDIRNYAVSSGLPAGFVNEIVDPVAIKLLNKAMMYDRGQQALSKTRKVVKTPKKIIKTSGSPVQPTGSNSPSTAKREMDKLRSSGSPDDAAQVFLKRMGVTD